MLGVVLGIIAAFKLFEPTDLEIQEYLEDHHINPDLYPFGAPLYLLHEQAYVSNYVRSANIDCGNSVDTELRMHNSVLGVTINPNYLHAIQICTRFGAHWSHYATIAHIAS